MLPYYNILEVAYSSVGYKHTPEAIAKMRAAKLGVSKTTSFKSFLSDLHKGVNNPFYGRSHSDSSKKAISIAKSLKLFLYDANSLELLVEFSSHNEARLAFESNLTKYIDTNLRFRGNYFLKTTLINPLDSINQTNLFNRTNLINLVCNLKHGTAPFYVYDAKS
jgi:group I intron endonuclease